MAKTTVKEIKGITNFGFYPDHYLTTALASDARAADYNGEALKALRKTLQPALANLAEEHSDALIKDVSQAWFKALGFYDTPAVQEKSLRIALDGKDFDFPVERILSFTGDNGVMALMIDSSDASVTPEAAESSKSSEHFYTKDSPLKMKDKDGFYSWKDVISAAFNSDYSTAEWLMIASGDMVYLLERGKWQESEAYLTVDLATLFAVNADEGYQITESLLSARSFPIASAESFHDLVGRNAHKKAAEVTKALRDTVRESVEILANQILDAHKASPLKGLKAFNFDDPSEREEAAKLIFDQSLRYIYRMLFMLFTESQDSNKGSLPVHSKAYQLGYAIEKLRNLELVPFLDDSGNFIQQTLEQAFKIYYEGYHTDRKTVKNPGTSKDELLTDALGFSFPAVGTDLFSSAKTSLFGEVVIKDRAMQEVIRRLSLAKVGSGKSARTHRVHYAGLGLNQLGAVYEGLLSLKPVILKERVALLKKESKEAAYRYVPYSKIKDYDDDLFEVTERGDILDRKAGTFMLAPVGLERKFSASFYTPEVLTRFVAKEAVDLLLEKDSSLSRMENVKICEPAMGSGAFLNGVVDELAKRMAQEYSKIDHDKVKKYREDCERKGKTFRKDEAPAHHEMPHYVAKAKEHLMTHGVYGVDLNPTAVELAKISLWLNCLHENGNLPFLDFKLKHGNSLVGGWIKRHQIKVAGKEYPHFFIPHAASLKPHLEGTILGRKDMPFIDDDGLRDRVSKIQSGWKDALNDQSLTKRLDKLLAKVMGLYEHHLNVRRKYRETLNAATTAEAKKQIFEKFLSEDTAYNQLRAMMDYWCSLWFWPNSELQKLPTVDNYVTALEWYAATELTYGGQDRDKKLKESGLDELKISRTVALEQCFFHWDLEFAEVFEEGGFDLVVGNPPWAKVCWEEEDFFEAVRPGLHAKVGDAKAKQGWYQDVLSKDKTLEPYYLDEKCRTLGFVSFLKESVCYPFEDNSLTNTYKYFFQRFYETTKPSGIYGLIAQDGVFTDDGNSKMRIEAYKNLVRSYRFHNFLGYFEDVDGNAQFLITFSNKGKSNIDFEIIDNLLDVSTVASCRQESAVAPYVGMKNSLGKWELRGHPKRIVRVNDSVLKSLGRFSPGRAWNETTLPIIHGEFELKVICKLAGHSAKIMNLDWYHWRQFDESSAPKKGLIKRDPGKAKDIRYAVYKGPNIFVGNPAAKAPNPGCKNKMDFSIVDLNTISSDFYPDSVFQCTEKGLKSNEYRAMTSWGLIHNEQYRIISRAMVNTTGTRTLSSALIPPGPSHDHSLHTLSFSSFDTLTWTSGLFNSLIYDFLVRTLSGGNLTKGVYEMMPTLDKEQLDSPILPALMIRALRLSSISNHYGDLWKSVWRPEFCDFEFKSEFAPKLSYSKLKSTWVYDSCIRDERAREQALCEIDVIVAELFGFSKETLLNLYRAQFGVLQSNIQDHPGQKIDPEAYHFPRYQQMSDAFDQLKAMTGRLKKAS
jgi:hypothetical protein